MTSLITSRKQLFVLKSEWKPIYSKESFTDGELASVCGLLQALPSLLLNVGDNIRSMSAGHRKIVYFMRGYILDCVLNMSNDSVISARYILS